MPHIRITQEIELWTPTEADPYEYRNTIILCDIEDDDRIEFERSDIPNLIKELQKVFDEPEPIPPAV